MEGAKGLVDCCDVRTWLRCEWRLGVAQAEVGRQGAFEDTALSAEDASIGAATVEAEDAGQGMVRVTGGGTHCDGVTEKLV